MYTTLYFGDKQSVNAYEWARFKAVKIVPFPLDFLFFGQHNNA